MNIKQYAFHVHAHLRAQGMASLTRSQVHELLTATAGFATHAAFQHQAAWMRPKARMDAAVDVLVRWGDVTTTPYARDKRKYLICRNAGRWPMPS